ncbi:hypothetical protein Q7P36_006455 [Cladosporium allicinum]
MAPSTPPPSASAGPALFHATSARHRQTCTRNSGYAAALAAAPTRVLRVVNGDSPVVSSPSPDSPSTATASANRDSLFSLAGEDCSSHTSGDQSSYYITARGGSSSSSSLLSAEEFHSRRYTERRDSDVGSSVGEFPTIKHSPSRRDSDVVSVYSSASSEEFPMRRNNPSRLTSDLGSDSSAAVAASLAENRRIFSEGFERMAAHQAQLEALTQRILARQERARSEVVILARKKMRAVEGRRRATTEQEEMQMMVEAVPFSADGRGHCEEAEVRRVALRGVRWSMMSDSPYPRVYR